MVHDSCCACGSWALCVTMAGIVDGWVRCLRMPGSHGWPGHKMVAGWVWLGETHIGDWGCTSGHGSTMCAVPSDSSHPAVGQGSCVALTHFALSSGPG